MWSRISGGREWGRGTRVGSVERNGVWHQTERLELRDDQLFRRDPGGSLPQANRRHLPQGRARALCAVFPLLETTYNESIPLFFYIRADSKGSGKAEIGYFGKAWYELAPGFDGEGAGKVQPPNEEYLYMKPVGGGGDGTGIDGTAVAVKWKAPEKGTYRVAGEWLPGGLKDSPEGVNTISLAILSSKGKALVPRKVVEDDGPVQPFDLEVKMDKDEEIIFIVGSDGSARGNMVGLKAKIETK